MSLLSTARAARALSLGIWLGGIVMSFIVARVIFDERIGLDRMRAGGIVFIILQQAGRLKTALALIAIGAEALIFYSRASDAPKGWRRHLPAALLLLASAIALFAILWLLPRIIELREQIADFSEKTAGSEQRLEFGRWHGASMALLLLEAVLVAASLVTGIL